MADPETDAASGTLHRDPQRTSLRLAGVLTLLDTNPAATVNDVRLALGHHALLLPLYLLAALAVPFALIPPISCLLGLGMLALSLQLAFRQSELWLPSAWLVKPAPAALRTILPPLIRLFTVLEAFAQPRYPQFSETPLHHFSGFLFVVLSLAIALPIPFGNIMPAIAILLLAFGHMQEDGIWIALGQMLGLLTIGGLLVITMLVMGTFGTATLLTGR